MSQPQLDSREDRYRAESLLEHQVCTSCTRQGTKLLVLSLTPINAASPPSLIGAVPSYRLAQLCRSLLRTPKRAPAIAASIPSYPRDPHTPPRRILPLPYVAFPPRPPRPRAAIRPRRAAPSRLTPPPLPPPRQMRIMRVASKFERDRALQDAGLQVSPPPPPRARGALMACRQSPLMHAREQ